MEPNPGLKRLQLDIKDQFKDIAIDQVAESWASRIKYVLPKSVVLISGQQAYTFPTGAMVEVIRLV